MSLGPCKEGRGLSYDQDGLIERTCHHELRPSSAQVEPESGKVQLLNLVLAQGQGWRRSK